jgi:MFS-type transporter involved in bile tolerance (Atg22 family)
MDTTSTIIGLIRDAVAAVIGLAILFGVNWSDEQTAGILLVVTTVGALGAYLWAQYRRSTAA